MVIKWNKSCEGKRNRLTVKGLVPNKRYFIDLFGVHTKLENLTFLLNSSSMWFNRSRPIRIKENSMTTFQVPLSGRPVAFTYKIPMHTTCRQIKLFTIPCGRNIRLKIISKLNNNATIMELHKSETIVLNSIPQEKFVFKLSTNEMSNGRSSRKIKLNPERYYAVYVMLRSNNISLPYDKLLINTNSMCAFEFKTYRDNHGSIIPYDLM
ncbi:hypothetical protein HA402_004656 [Bradysia odoriphaga]|nr:hypothetical protein HA402_004656 [Bradysia odoriphaga]